MVIFALAQVRVKVVLPRACLTRRCVPICIFKSSSLTCHSCLKEIPSMENWDFII